MIYCTKKFLQTVFARNDVPFLHSEVLISFFYLSLFFPFFFHVTHITILCNLIVFTLASIVILSFQLEFLLLLKELNSEGNNFVFFPLKFHITFIYTDMEQEECCMIRDTNLFCVLICTQYRVSYFEIGFLLNISTFFKLMLRSQKITEEATLFLSVLQIMFHNLECFAIMVRLLLLLCRFKQ